MPRKKVRILQLQKVSKNIFTNLNKKRSVDLRSIQEISLHLLKDEERVADELLKPVREHCSENMLRFIERNEVINALMNKGYYLKTIDVSFVDIPGFRTGRQIRTELRILYFLWSDAVSIKIENTEKHVYEIEMRVIS